MVRGVRITNHCPDFRPFSRRAPDQTLPYGGSTTRIAVSTTIARMPCLNFIPTLAAEKHNCKFMVASSIVLVFAGAAVPPTAIAQCSANGWCRGGESDVAIDYIKVLSRNGRFVTALERTVCKPGACDITYEINVQYDCRGLRYRAYQGDGKYTSWSDVRPNTIWDTNHKTACILQP